MKNLLIVGAGVAGQLLVADIKNGKTDYRIVGVVDDNFAKGSVVSADIEVLGKIADIPEIIKLYKIDRTIIALPSERGDLIRKIVLSLYELENVEIFLIPRISDIILGGKVTFEDAKQICLTDLVGDNLIKSDQQKLQKMFAGITVLVTGGGGSIGSELVKQIFLSVPKRIIVLDICEKNLFYIGNDLARLKEINPDTSVELVLGDIKNRPLLDELFSTYSIHTVFHAAAYKHVPLLEDNVYEAVSNNILGTFNICYAAKKYGVKKLVLISTDKAVNPINVMGKTKRAAELVMMYFNNGISPSFSAVRFGNVFSSSGSAVEVFINQIENNLPIRVTNSEMTRYFITIQEAVHLVLQAWFLSHKNSIYMLEMGEAVNILELAKCIATIKGGNGKTKIEIVGDRKGEKQHEVLYHAGNEIKKSTKHKKIFSITNKKNIDYAAFEKNLTNLLEVLDEESVKNHSTYGSIKLKRLLNSLIS